MCNAHDHLTEGGREGNGIGEKKKKTGHANGTGPHEGGWLGHMLRTLWFK